MNNDPGKKHISGKARSRKGFPPFEAIIRFLSGIIQCIPNHVQNHFSRKTRSLTGFTLLELLLSITLMSLVALIIGSGFRLGLRAWEKGEKEVRSTQKLRALSGLLQQDLKSVYPYQMEIDNEKIMLFEGDEHSILFVTTLGKRSTAGLKWAKYSYDEKNRTLIYNEGILPDKDVLRSTADDSESEVVDDDIEEMSFEFFSLEEDWSKTWDIGEELPSAVRVHMKYYPSLLITLPMTLEKNKEKRERNDGMFKGF